MKQHTLIIGISLALCGGLPQGVIAADATDEINVSTQGGLSVKTGDGNFEFKFGGRIMVDAAVYDEDEDGGDGEDDELFNDGTEFRRARLFAEGLIYRDWKFKAEYDFAENEIEIKDVYLAYKPAGITVGQFKMPFSLEELTSSRFITFMERGLPNAFATSRRIGLGYHTGADRWSFGAAVYGQEAGAGDGGDEGFGAGGRFTFAPWVDDGRVLHLGAAAAWEEPEDDASETIRLRERPESHLTGTRLVDTDDIAGVDDLTKYGLEAAAVFGPVSLQGEYIRADVSRATGDDLAFDGYYAYVSWFLTGESRPYEADKGVFDRVKPKGRAGAWELGLRYSNLDLMDGAIAGGEQDNITVGVNWYLNPYVRIMGNYIRVDAEDSPVGDEVDPNIFQVRFQVDF